ncbi:hypothetical protein GQX74_010296 [Glossina fuscipes]|nr:hypothetical protein GQX74_010296 [Glossina fuscipes]
MSSSTSPRGNRSNSNNRRSNNTRQNLYGQALQGAARTVGYDRFNIANSNESSSRSNERNNARNINRQQSRGSQTNFDATAPHYSNINSDSNAIAYPSNLRDRYSTSSRNAAGTAGPSTSRYSSYRSNSYAFGAYDNQGGGRRSRRREQPRRTQFRRGMYLRLTMPLIGSSARWSPYWESTASPLLLVPMNNYPTGQSGATHSVEVLNTSDIANSFPSYQHVTTQWLPQTPINMYRPIYLLYYAALVVDHFPGFGEPSPPENDVLPQGLTRDEIATLPSYICCDDTTTGYCTSCAVCLHDFELQQILRVLPCTHTFHAECVDKWLEMRRTCPVCRALCSPTQEQ